MNSVTPKEILLKNPAQETLLKGVNTLADAVKVTMGPGGENVIIEVEDGPPILTKDGVTVAKAIALSMPFENMGVQVLKEAAQRTAETAGDGTTTSTVVAQALVNGGQKLIAAGHNPVKVREGMFLASRAVKGRLEEISTPLRDRSDIINVGRISANGDEKIGTFLADAMQKVGKDGVITVDEAKGFETTLDVVDGFEINRGYVSPYFVTNQVKNTVEFVKPKILLVNYSITSIKDLVPVLEDTRRNGDSLLIIADDIEGDALKVCVLNSIKGIVKVCALKAPAFGAMRTEMLNDLSLLFNTRVYTRGESLPTTTSELGTCEMFTGYRGSSVFVCKDNREEETQAKINEIIDMVTQMKKSPSLSSEEMAYLERRQAVLSGGIAVIRVGGSTELELRERKDRIDDAVCATRAAVNSGIVPGGGSALFRASLQVPQTKQLDVDESIKAGWNLLLESVKKPMAQISKNAGYVPEIIMEKAAALEDDGIGFDARSGEWVNMLEVGIIDPLAVVTSALEHATSAAINLLSVGCAIVNEKE